MLTHDEIRRRVEWARGEFHGSPASYEISPWPIVEQLLAESLPEVTDSQLMEECSRRGLIVIYDD